ncbi:MAG: hypothetical protein WD739_07100 [Actinomycetota bacterium]
MIRRLVPVLLLMAVAASLLAAVPGSATAGEAPEYRPDQWIKLCGLSNGCKINPLPHPWRGRNVYNKTGAKQSVSVRMEDGEGVRFWLALQTDGTAADTLRVDGCRGNRRFRVNKVQIGKYKNPNAGAVKITEKFKEGTATFDYGANSDKIVYLTLNIIAPTTAEGVSYRCEVTLISEGDPTKRDTVSAKMTTY